MRGKCPLALSTENGGAIVGRGNGGMNLGTFDADGVNRPIAFFEAAK
jgi:hypothetical protein